MTDSVTIESASIVGRDLSVRFSDGRRIFAPLDSYPLLRSATEDQLAKFRLSPFGLHWSDLDEDIGVGSLLSTDRLDIDATTIRASSPRQQRTRERPLPVIGDSN